MIARRVVLLLTALLLLAPAARAQDPEKAGKRFWEARRAMLAGESATAAELFRTIEAADPSDAVADDCLYWMGRCYLRINDREPDAVVAFLKLIKVHPKSPFLDDAARELGRLGDRTAIPLLKARLGKEGTEAELAARALAELDDESGIAWLQRKAGEKEPRKEVAATRKKGTDAKPAGQVDELSKLKEEIRRLKKEVEEAVALVKKLLEDREKAGGKNGK